MVVITEEDDSYSDDEIDALRNPSTDFQYRREDVPAVGSRDACSVTTDGASATRGADTDAASEASGDEWHDAVEIPDEDIEQRDLPREKGVPAAEEEKAGSSSAVDDKEGDEGKAGWGLQEDSVKGGVSGSKKNIEVGFSSLGIGEATAGEEKLGEESQGESSAVGASTESSAGREEAMEPSDALLVDDKNVKSTEEALAEAEQVKAEGNKRYTDKDYGPALDLYYHALDLCPVTDETAQARAVYHANAAICHLQLGEYEESALQSTKAVELNGSYMKAFMRRAQAYEALNREEDALADYKKVLELDTGNKQAQEGVRKLEPIVAEKREKLKEEMLGKLKDLGNTLLGHFGLSVDNFKAVQDPSTGSYSINFQK